MRYPKVAYRFKKLLADNNITAQQLADTAHIGKASISHYVNGTHCPSTETAGKIADIYDVNPAYLMGFDATPKKPRDPSKAFDFESPRYNIDTQFVLSKIIEMHESIPEMAKESGISEERLIEILSGEGRKASEKEVRDIAAFLETFSINLITGHSISGYTLNDVMQQLDNVKESINNINHSSSNEYSEDEKMIISKYRNSDPLTQAMVKRTLGID